MLSASSPIVVSRKARTSDGSWHEARSWFGGRPRLGSVPWPRGRSGKPLVFAAQIDLADIAAAEPEAPLPSAGSLAFFLEEGAVVFVPAGADGTPTKPPADATPAFEPNGDIFPQKPSPWARMEFPYWPVELTALDLGMVERDPDDDDSYERARVAMAEAVAARFRTRPYFFTAKQACEVLGGEAALFWWHGALVYAEQLRIAQFHAADVAIARRPWLEKARAEVARLTPKRAFGVFGRKAAAPDEALQKALKELQRYEAQEVDYRRQLAGFGSFIAEADSFADGRDPWAPMLPREVEAFTALVKRGRREFEDLVRYRTHRGIDDLATETMLAMMTGDERAFAALPAPIRDHVNTRYLLPTQGWHQMFGFGVDIQGGAVWENEGNHLLLQLVYDDMVHWKFGDMGAFQFWISPGDLAAWNWSGAKLTFECH